MEKRLKDEKMVILTMIVGCIMRMITSLSLSFFIYIYNYIIELFTCYICFN